MAGLHVPGLRTAFPTNLFRGNQQCYSAVIGGGPCRPIAAKEFLAAWTKVHPQSQNREERNRGRIGFGISGGVDSMVLASLFSHASTEFCAETRWFPEPIALIVDHRLRKDSSEEAKWVANELEMKLNMKAKILTPQWPNDVNPRSSSTLETNARTLRYRALGIACRDLGIPSLVLAHHADDQAETIVLRLLQQRFRYGLKGIESIVDIPECHGIHGVHKSGTLPPRDHIKPGLNIELESGGVQLLRPLLGFGKDRLISTAKAHNVAWVEDATNLDRTLTARNAIRHIMTYHKLPAALSKERLVTVANRMQDRIETHAQAAKSLFDTLDLKLDTQTGSVIVRLPPKSALLDRQIITKEDEDFAHNTGTLLLHHLIRLVSPFDQKASISNVTHATNLLYPRGSEPSSPGPKSNSFSVQGVWFRRWTGPSPFSQSSNNNDPGDINESCEHFCPREFLLTRIPFSPAGENASPTIEFPPHNHNRGNDIFHFWDSRFWIRISNPTSKPLILRSFKPSELEQLSLLINNARKASKGEHVPTSELPTDIDVFFRELVSRLKPVDLRFTIPAVFEKNETGKQDKLLGFPSLMIGPRLREGVCWEVRYKKADIGEKEMVRMRPRISR